MKLTITISDDEYGSEVTRQIPIVQEHEMKLLLQSLRLQRYRDDIPMAELVVPLISLGIDAALKQYGERRFKYMLSEFHRYLIGGE